MKILRLKIKDKSEKIIRDIKFSKNRISFIFGDIQNPDDSKKSLNSLGKTLLLKFIDYIYGANEDKTVIKKIIHGYTIEATVMFNGKNYLVKRTLGNSNISIDDMNYSLTNYKLFFQINRPMFKKQILLEEKKTLIGNTTSATKDDFMMILKLLDFDELLNSIDEIYSSQDKIKQYKKNKKDSIKFYSDDVSENEIDQEIFIIGKQVEKMEIDISDISKKIKNIQTTDLKSNIIEEYSNQNYELKLLKKELERNKIEIKRLEKFISDSNKIDITADHILAIYDKTKIEVPMLIKKRLEDVEEFHKKVYEERKEFLSIRKDKIIEKLDAQEKEMTILSKKIDELGNLISENEVYQESILIYEKYNKDLQELKYKEGQISQINEIKTQIENEDTDLIDYFDKAQKIINNKYQEIIKIYRNFIYTLTENIYEKTTSSYFEINIKKKHQTTRPIDLKFNIKGDTGEGVGKVKKIIIDILILNFNSYLEFLIQDSSCYNGVDPRQLLGLLKKINEICEFKNKQAIFAVNKYQFGDFNDEFLSLFNNDISLNLSETDKLLKFDFD